MSSSEIDGARFSQLILESERMMRSLVLAMVPGCRDVDDIIQEACSAMWKKLDLYDAQRPFAPWSMTFVKLQVLAYLKKRKRDRLQLSDQSMESVYQAVAADASHSHENEKLMALEDCLTTLDNQERSLLNKRFVEGHTVKEISNFAGIKQSQEALYKKLSRLQSRLLDCINGKLLSRSHDELKKQS